MNFTDKKIKVLFISHSSAMAGAERSLLLLLSNIDRNRFEPIVLFPDLGPLKELVESFNIQTHIVHYVWWARVDNIKIPFKNIRGFRFYLKKEILAIKKIIKIIKKEKIDIVYTNTSVITIGAVAAYITKKPHIWHIREIIPDNPDLKYFLPNKILLNFIVKYSNIVIANSKFTAYQFSNIKNYNKKIRIVYNAVKFDSQNVQNNNSIISDKVSQNDWLVSVIGTLLKAKSQEDAIYAINIAKQKIPNIKLLVVGGGDNKYKDYLQNIVTSLKLDNRVLFLGFRNDVSLIIKKSNVILTTSLMEPFGNVTLEAMQYGVPIIGVNTGGTKEIITDGIDGFLVSPHSPEMIAEKLILLYENPEIANKLALAGKKTIAQKFNLYNYIQAIEKIIESFF